MKSGLHTGRNFMLRSRLIISLIATASLVFIGVGVFVTAAQGSAYTVQAGDTLDGIAAFYDVQTDCLAKSNNLAKPSEIKPGDVINIDMSCPTYDGFDFVTNPRDEGGGSSSDLG